MIHQQGDSRGYEVQVRVDQHPSRLQNACVCCLYLHGDPLHEPDVKSKGRSLLIIFVLDAEVIGGLLPPFRLDRLRAKRCERIPRWRIGDVI